MSIVIKGCNKCFELRDIANVILKVSLHIDCAEDGRIELHARPGISGLSDRP